MPKPQGEAFITDPREAWGAVERERSLGRNSVSRWVSLTEKDRMCWHEPLAVASPTLLVWTDPNGGIARDDWLIQGYQVQAPLQQRRSKAI